MYYVYIIQSTRDSTWYTGSTNDLRKRFNEHNSGKVLSTKGRGPFELIYYEGCLNESDARDRERYLKSGMGKKYLKNRMKRFLSVTGFTLLELLIVVVIIGILASLAIPRYQKTVESSKAAEAYTNMNAVRIAQWEYKGRAGHFLPLNIPTMITWNYLSIENPNNVPLTQRHFEYTSWLLSSGQPGVQPSFKVKALRKGGPYNGDFIEMDANGNIDESNWLQ